MFYLPWPTWKHIILEDGAVTQHSEVLAVEVGMKLNKSLRCQVSSQFNKSGLN